MSIHCPKCKAGRASLDALTETLADGTTLQTVRCVVCSWRTSRQVAPSHDNPRRKKSEFRQITSAHAGALRKARLDSVAKHSAPCAVPGCEGTHYTLTASLPLCKVHRTRLRSWEESKRTTWPSVACVNGHWLERGHPLPAIPGERPAPVPAAEVKPRKPAPRARKRAKPRQSPAAIPAAAMPYESLEAELGRLAALGNPSARALVGALKN